MTASGLTDHDPELSDLVRARQRTDPADGSTVYPVLKRTIDGFDPKTDEHWVWWHGQAWADAPVWSPDTRGRLQRLTDELSDGLRDDGWVRISRDDVFRQHASDEPLDLFLAAMAWGFGTVGYGWRRTADIINAAGEDEVRRAVACLRKVGAEDGAAEVWRAWSWGGSAKLRGLGTAFASKVAYFASFDRSQGSGPLIADINTAWALWALADIWDSRAGATHYCRYVSWAEQQAALLDCRSDDVERALFTLGRMVREIWDADH